MRECEGWWRAGKVCMGCVRHMRVIGMCIDVVRVCGGVMSGRPTQVCVGGCGEGCVLILAMVWVVSE